MTSVTLGDSRQREPEEGPEFSGVAERSLNLQHFFFATRTTSPGTNSSVNVSIRNVSPCPSFHPNQTEDL